MCFSSFLYCLSPICFFCFFSPPLFLFIFFSPPPVSFHLLPGLLRTGPPVHAESSRFFRIFFLFFHTSCFFFVFLLSLQRLADFPLPPGNLWSCFLLDLWKSIIHSFHFLTSFPFPPLPPRFVSLRGHFGNPNSHLAGPDSANSNNSGSIHWSPPRALFLSLFMEAFPSQHTPLRRCRVFLPETPFLVYCRILLFLFTLPSSPRPPSPSFGEWTCTAK